MSKIHLSLVFHNHQPVGNFDYIFHDAYEKAYKPLTDCLDRHPTILAAMHFTGPLLDWLMANQPAYLKQVASQVQRGQLEIMTGAYYEPILAMLQDTDKLGQIQKLNQTVEQLFGTSPAGMWLAERIWEPHFPKPLQEAGIQYTILDDAHFQAAGFSAEDLFGYFVSEEQGQTINLVPSHRQLRYLVPWKPVEDVISWLQEQADQRNSPGKPPAWAVMADDGEKFGYWPETYNSIWVEGWLDEFFTALEQNAEWVQLIHPKDYITQFRPRGRAYLPTASYMEMGEWALPSPASWELRDLREQYQQELEVLPEWDQEKREETGRVLKFLRGSFWRNFLVKYPEINHMQKRGLSLSQRIHALPPSPTREKALNALWASQCNCAYWHGVFGGVYLFHIRSANYSNIIEAELLLGDGEKASVQAIDFNADGFTEVLASNGPLQVVVEPALGGMLTELDYRPAKYNLLNIMTRHPEGYHIQIQEAADTNMLMTPGDDRSQFEGEPVRAKEKGLEKYIYVDWHRRGMFVDHFPGEQTTLQNFEASQYPEQGDFVDQQYQVEVLSAGPNPALRLVRDGYVWVRDIRLPVQVTKTIHLEDETIIAAYAITNKGDVPLTTRFGVELAFGLDGGDNREYCVLEVNGNSYGLGSTGEVGGVTHYRASTKLRKVTLEFSVNRSATLWRFPLAPITLSEGGFERVHQGMVSFPWWVLNLAPGETWETEIKLALTPLK